MKVLIQLDDLGFSEGVNYGIEKVVREFPNVCVGMMMNMPRLQHGYDLIKEHTVCLGIHMNITAGKPICKREDIPSLVNEQGDFHSSATYRKSAKDTICLQEAEKECEAQYQAFLETTAKKPSYIDVHALQSDTFSLAVETIANRHSVLFNRLGNQDNPTKNDHNVYIKVAQNSMISKTKDIDELCRTSRCENNILIFHPGYADAYIMKHSSINIQRIYDVDTLTSPNFLTYLQEKGITLMTYPAF